MGTQTERGNGGPRIYVGPERDHFGAEHANGLLGAVERGGGVVVDEPGEAEALVWLGSDNSKLPKLLHPGIRWVQLPSAGGGVLDGERAHRRGAHLYLGGGRVLGGGGRARPRADARGREEAARVRPRDELGGGWMGAPLQRLDHRDLRRRRNREGSDSAARTVWRPGAGRHPQRARGPGCDRELLRRPASSGRRATFSSSLLPRPGPRRR